MNWHLLPEDELLQMLDTRANGLLHVDAQDRLQRHGLNELQPVKKQPVWQKLLRQLADFMTLILLAAAVVSGIIGDATDALIILLIVVLNTIIGFVQEYRAEKAVEALRSMAAPVAWVRRDGVPRQIPGKELVPGDWVLLEAGQVVPADIRLMEVHSLKVQEAALTGESHDVEKRQASCLATICHWATG